MGRVQVLVKVVLYVLAFVVPPVLVSVVGVKVAQADRYAPRPSGVAVAPATSAVPPLDPGKPTAVILLNHPGTEVTDVLAPFEVFVESGAFNTYLVAPERGLVTLSGGLDVLPHLSFADLDRLLGGATPEIVVVPAMWDVGSEAQRPVADWLRRHAAQARTVMSVCDGAEVMADAGLLEGRRVTANRANLGKWQARYPGAAWVAGKRYVEDGNLLSSAGVTSGINAALHLVRRYVGPPAAADLARRIGYPDQRIGAEPSIPTDRLTASERALYVLGGAYNWRKLQIGVLLTEGVSEIELASAFDTYPGPAFTGRSTSMTAGGPAAPITSAHGLLFVPRERLSEAPVLDRLLVPGRAAARSARPDLQAWWDERGVEPEFIHADLGAGFPFDPTLRHLAEHANAPWAQFTAKLLEYPTDHLALSGPGWPWQRLLLLLLLGGLGLGGVITGRRLILLIARRQRSGEHG